MTILSALSMVLGAPGWLAVTGIIVAVVAMSKSFLGTYFGVIEGASEIVKSSLGLLGVRKSRAFNRAMSILLVSAFTFAVCFINPNAISMILRYQRTAYRHDPVYYAHAVDMAHSGAEAVPLGG
ncbi:serine transporter [Klebsiella pneumoniae]|uniref:Serine transporter n=1 Tax=Klebsiella pneumoniae TaxID=573 RepID=A0A377XB11_KLEPN|nr:serine transporter [Klebsiella pneumoniae]